MFYLTLIGAAFVIWVVFVTLFTPHIPYHIEANIDSTGEHFVQVLESTLQTKMTRDNGVEVFTDGTRFYPAMLAAISHARETINFECYIFRQGAIGRQFVEALSERARAGVGVRLVVDAIGSLGTFRQIARPLRDAGCQVELYQKITWWGLGRLNNRTHRELLVVDGRIAFAGGAGVADWWALPQHGKPLWRDMMLRFEGPVVSDIQGIMAENWLECCGEVLTGLETYKARHPAGTTSAFAVKSSPSDRATTSRVLFQILVESANEEICITTPYFLPDKAFREAFVRTATRGVNIRIVLPGAQTDQHWVRLASRRLYGQLLKAGVSVYEYQPGMTHVKSLEVDGLWSAIGTTNFDNRSFEHNDEVNVVVRDRQVAARLRHDFEADIARSREVGLHEWQRRPIWEKVVGTVAWVLERQQ